MGRAWQRQHSSPLQGRPRTHAPYPGAVLSARYQGRIVRVKVEAYREEDAVSIGSVAAILDQRGHRFQSHQNLNVGDMVRPRRQTRHRTLGRG